MYNLKYMWKTLKIKSKNMILIYVGILLVLFFSSFSAELFQKDSQRYFYSFPNNFIYGTESLKTEDCSSFYQSIEDKNKTLNANGLDVKTTNFYFEKSFKLNNSFSTYDAIIGSNEYLLELIYRTQIDWIFKNELINDSVYLPDYIYEELNHPKTLVLSDDATNFKKEYSINGIFKSNIQIKTIFYGTSNYSYSLPLIVNETAVSDIFKPSHIETCSYIIELKNKIKEEDATIINNLYGFAEYSLKQENNDKAIMNGVYNALYHLVFVVFIIAIALVTLLFCFMYKSLKNYLDINSIFYLSIKKRYLYSFLPNVILFTIPLIGILTLGLVINCILYINFNYFISLFQPSVFMVYLYVILMVLIIGFIDIHKTRRVFIKKNDN